MKRLLFAATPEQDTKLNELMSITTLYKKRVFSFVQIFTDPIRDIHDHTIIIRRNSLTAKGTHIGCNILINQRVPRTPDSLQTKLVFSEPYSNVCHVDYVNVFHVDYVNMFHVDYVNVFHVDYVNVFHVAI